MLARDQPALAVAGIAVGEIGRLAVNADRPGFFFPLDDALVRDVAAEQIAPVAEPDRPSAQRKPVVRRSTADSFSQYFSNRGSSAWIAGSG